MEQTFRKHLQEVHDHYAANDFALAFRRLVDCVIETRNPALFRDTLQYCDWLDEHDKAAPDEIRSKAVQLLEKAGNAGLKPVDDHGGGRILSVQGLKKTYRKGNFKLEGLDFDLDAGNIIGLVGENGNGKTTLLRLLAAELSPDAGKIHYHFSGKKGDDYTVKTKLVYIEQRIPRWYGSLVDNLQFTLAHYGISGEENLLWAELMIARLGLRPFRKLSWNRISSGYRTRFELAKTLLRQPRILLLDEPLANLDIISQQTILQDLRYMAGSLTAPFGMILSSQHIYEVEKVSDRIIFLKNGVPQYQQSAAEIKDTPALALIFELEANCTREQLAAAFDGLPLQKLQFNGGVYTIQFEGSAGGGAVLNALATHHIDVVYLRNISHSSRRFFIN